VGGTNKQILQSRLTTQQTFVKFVDVVNVSIYIELLFHIFLSKNHMKIFIQIASYRDPELEKTIKSAIENAKKPKNLVFGIARQYHPDDKFDTLEEYRKDKRFRILDIPYLESNGACWARNQIQQLYKGEE
jgi:hypothetical protein